MKNMMNLMINPNTELMDNPRIYTRTTSMDKWIILGIYCNY